MLVKYFGLYFFFTKYLSVDSCNMPIKAAFSLELFETDAAVKTHPIVFCVDVHISTSS